MFLLVCEGVDAFETDVAVDRLGDHERVVGAQTAERRRLQLLI